MKAKLANDEKFESIYRAYVDSVFRVSMYYAKDKEAAQEITQTTFFKLYTHWKNVDLEYVEPWLVTTARNLSYNYTRDSKHDILDEVLEVILETKDILEHVESTENYYMRESQKEFAKKLNDRIFDRLYREHRQWYDAVTLVYCFGKKQQEVADELGITIEVLHSRLYRAKQWIRKNYGKKYEEIANWFCE